MLDHANYDGSASPVGKKGSFKKRGEFQRQESDTTGQSGTSDPQDKFFKNRTEGGPIKFIRCIKIQSLLRILAASKAEPTEKEEQTPKPTKPNPFGEAVPRDETQFLKKKEVIGGISSLRVLGRKEARTSYTKSASSTNSA